MKPYLTREEEVKLAMLGDAHAKLTPKEEILEFGGEYLGGHIQFPNKCRVILQLGDKLYVTATSYQFDPFIEIPYKRISTIQSLPNERISTLRVLAVGVIGGLLWRKRELYLTITFKDDVSINQTIVFKMDDTEEAQRAIYYKVAEAKKKKSVTNKNKK